LHLCIFCIQEYKNIVVVQFLYGFIFTLFSELDSRVGVPLTSVDPQYDNIHSMRAENPSLPLYLRDKVRLLGTPEISKVGPAGLTESFDITDFLYLLRSVFSILV